LFYKNIQDNDQKSHEVEQKKKWQRWPTNYLFQGTLGADLKLGLSWTNSRRSLVC